MQRHHLGWLTVIALAVPLVTACGATRGATPAASALPGCPSADPGPLTPHAARCDSPAGLLPFDQLIRLSYAGGATSHALVTFTSCEFPS